MRKTFLVSLVLVLSVIFVFSCGKSQTGGSSTTTTISPTEDKPITPTNGVQGLFNVSGAKAIVSAMVATGTGVKAAADAQANDVLKMYADGHFESIFNFGSGYDSYHPNITVIEKGPDGSLYVGFQNQIWFYDSSYKDSSSKDTASKGSQGVALFRIKTNGSVEAVDTSISGMGSWYNSSNNGELSAKQIQFDSSGNVYYLGRDKDWNTLLKKKTSAGVISQIGSSMMAVRDFVVSPNGLVFFHGSDLGDWTKEWLRVFFGGASDIVFYNESSGWLRAYYIDKDNNVILVGDGVTIYNPADGSEMKYSGIIKVVIDQTTGKKKSATALFDDKNMYSDNSDYNTIENQIAYGYWDSISGSYKKFFKTNSYGGLPDVTTLEVGITDDAIRAFIRNKFQTISADALSSLTFEGMAITGSGTEDVHGTIINGWSMKEKIGAEINYHIQGVTWKQWRESNGLSGVAFASAKQIIPAEDGSVYAVINKDNWGTLSKGDGIYKILNASGEVEVQAYPPYTGYKSIANARTYDHYIIYKSNKGGYYKIFRVDLNTATATPTDMTPDKTQLTIYSFNYNPINKTLMYNVYDSSNNTSYLVEQLITSTVAQAERPSTDRTVLDVVPFEATQ